MLKLIFTIATLAITLYIGQACFKAIDRAQQKTIDNINCMFE